MRKDIRGLTVIFTGDGKGKTSAAFGTVFRALGHGMKCKVIQFIKGTMDTGELHSAKRFEGLLEVVRAGEGFTWQEGKPREEHVTAAQKGLETAAKALEVDYGVVVLDEIIYAIRAGLVSIDDVLELVKKKPATTHLILTGRDAPAELVSCADMVSEVRPVKHPFEKGIPAQKGLDF